MLTENLTEITIDPTASGTVIMVTTITASKRKIPRKKMVILISRKMFTTVMTTLQISTSATTIMTYYRNDGNHTDGDDGCYCAHSKDFTNENDNNGNIIDLNNDSNDENVQDCIDDLYNINNKVDDEDCYKNQAEDYDSEIDADHYSDCNEVLCDYCPAERKVDNYKSRRKDYNAREKRYKNYNVHFINNREDDYGDFFYDEEHFYDIDEDSEIDTDSEKCDNAGNEDFSWGNDKFVNYTYTGSDGDYNCRDKQCCYESNDEWTDDEEYSDDQELEVVNDSDDDDSDHNVDDLYNDRENGYSKKRRYDYYYNRIKNEYYSVPDDYYYDVDDALYDVDDNDYYYNRIENEYYSVPNDYYDDVDDDDYKDCYSDHMNVKSITDTTSEDSSFGYPSNYGYNLSSVSEYQYYAESDSYSDDW
ncbi:hypothetical protein DPMN_142002 [Dreissena polymorpha]|uniref:Uncharacterized protein n=1 Tax=Dreissena polymorpha TaxID=45954 RepID=A0A9D4GAC1_DREPO|nr:hypothetical protein DPMN_142002 [Dreissena polymorpha]